jgi:hypothetical protein
MVGFNVAMSVYSDVADYQWLTGDEAAEFLRELAATEMPLHTAVARLRQHLSPERTHLLVEQVELRRRAAAKFAAAGRMFFTRIGLEQATDEHVARYKASRFATQRAGASSPPAIADVCCGIGGDLLALANVGSVIGVDRDPIAAHFAAHNTGAVVHCADVTQFDFSRIDAFHIDPDRRAAGPRTTSIDTCQPNRVVIEQFLRRVPHAAVKLAPATRVPATWAERCELEWISRGGECRQQVAWHGNLAHAPGQLRATILAKNPPSACDLSMRTLLGPPNQPVPVTSQIDEFVFDVDPAVFAGHLQGALAAEHNLTALAHGASYLTGPAPICDAALQCFRVADLLPLRVQSLARYFRDRGVGQLEIKQRGVDAEPEKLRRELKLRGDHAATLLITTIADRHAAIVAHRVDG